MTIVEMLERKAATTESPADVILKLGGAALRIGFALTVRRIDPNALWAVGFGMRIAANVVGAEPALPRWCLRMLGTGPR